MPLAPTGVSSSVGSSRRSGSASSPAASPVSAAAEPGVLSADGPPLASVAGDPGDPADPLFPPAALPLVPVAPPDGIPEPAVGMPAPAEGWLAPLLPAAPVPPPELPLGSGVLIGGDDCGCVGVLALGQPVSNRQVQSRPAIPGSSRHAVLL